MVVIELIEVISINPPSTCNASGKQENRLLVKIRVDLLNSDRIRHILTAAIKSSSFIFERIKVLRCKCYQLFEVWIRLNRQNIRSVESV